MRWVKKCATSAVVIGITIPVTYLLLNLLLAFSQELVRVYQLFRETGEDMASFMAFRQSYTTAFVYQPDYQLYYVSMWIVVSVGLLSGVIRIFTDMYKPKTTFRKRVERQRQEYAESRKQKPEQEKLGGALAPDVKFLPAGNDRATETNQPVSDAGEESKKERESIIDDIFREAEEKRFSERNKPVLDEVNIDEDELAGFEITRNSPDKSFEEIINDGDSDVAGENRAVTAGNEG